MDRRHGWSGSLLPRMCLLLALMNYGCAEQVTLREVVLEAADLRETRSAGDAELRGELERLEAERALPAQLGPELPPADQNVATALAKVIDPMLRRGILERSDALFPRGRFRFTPLELAEVRQFLAKHRSRLDRFYEALERPHCAFAIDYRLGFFDEPAFVDNVTICCRLLSFEAADRLASGEVAASLRPAAAIWRLAGYLGRERHLSARLAATDRRSEGLLVLEEIANHRGCRRGDLETLLQIVEDQLAQWPSDEQALVGDRAMTLHAYECIRRDLLPWVLTSEEKERFRQELSLDSLARVASETIDGDELFYLLGMRRHIELCRDAYYLRRSELARLAEQLDQARTSTTESDYPLLAAILFLPGIPEAHATFARDRARCEAAALALAHALGREPPAYTTNPHHGQPYVVVREAQRIVVRMGEADERDLCVTLPVE